METTRLSAALALFVGLAACGPSGTSDFPVVALRCQPTFLERPDGSGASDASDAGDANVAGDAGGAGDAAEAPDALGPDAGIPDPIIDNLTVELGAPVAGTFKPWSDGDTVSLIRGGQGGLMVGVHLRLSDRAERCAAVHIDVFAHAPAAVDLAPPAGMLPLLVYADGGFVIKDDGTTAALLIRVDDLSFPLPLTAVTLELRATVRTAAGRGGKFLTIHPTN